MLRNWAQFAGFAAFALFALVGSLLWALNYPPQNAEWTCKPQSSAEQDINKSGVVFSCRQSQSEQHRESPADRESNSDKNSDESIKITDKLLAVFTGLLVIVGAMQAYLLQETVSTTKETAEAAVVETRRLGEAQTRAYVDIREATVSFIGMPGLLNMGQQEVQPVVRIIAKNTGQSPARNFAWNPSVQYFAFVEPFGDPTGSTMEGSTIEGQLGGNWREILGVGISVGHDHPDGATVTGMLLLKFLRESQADMDSVLVQLRIQFEFTDVFDNRIVDEAFFAGIFKRQNSEPTRADLGETEWGTRQLKRLHRLTDWPDTPTTHIKSHRPVSASPMRHFDMPAR